MKAVLLLVLLMGSLSAAAVQPDPSIFLGKYIHAKNSPTLLQKGEVGLIVENESFKIILAAQTLTSEIIDFRAEKTSITLYGTKSTVLIMKQKDGTYSALFMDPVPAAQIGDEEDKKNRAFQHGMKLGKDGPSGIFVKKKLD